MKEREAEQQGLSFTGIYSSDKEVVKARIAQLREEHPDARIILVRVPHNKLSRGHGNGGYSAYADRVYFLQKQIRELGKKIDGHPGDVVHLELKQREGRQSLDDRHREERRQHAEFQQELMDLLAPKRPVHA